MAVFKAFRAVRPTGEYAAEIAALPYDVMSSEEAKEMVVGKPNSFLHVDKPEIDFDPIPENIYTKEIYNKAKENLDKLEASGVCKQDEAECFYIYRQTMNGRSQTGLVGCASIDDYMNNVIKKHELTRADKEQDRINHVNYCNANTGPIFLTYKQNDFISEAVEEWKAKRKPVYDFTTDDGVRNTVWVIDCRATIMAIRDTLDKTDSFYIADGHHRAASAVNVGKMRRKENPNYTGEEEFNFFLAVLFPSNELEIMDYNRVIKDLNGYTTEQFLDKMSESFDIKKIGSSAYKPTQKHTFGMLLDNEWYKLTAKDGTFDKNDPVAQLDVSILQANAIAPVFGIDDPRTDERIDFIGGIRGLKELEKRVNSDMKIAFAMYPTTLDDLMDIADANKIMPPKSTWFEPKLLSGLFVHNLS